MQGGCVSRHSRYLGLALWGLGACSGQEAVVDESALAAFRPALPADFATPGSMPERSRISLGRMLFYEKRLSKNQDIACNSCHGLGTYGVDNKRFSMGHRGQLGMRNSPTVYNAAGALAQFWDGRAKNVEQQARGPIRNSVEMAMPSDEQVTQVLRSIPGYAQEFALAFPSDREPVSFDNAAVAIGAFERQLVTPSRWDRFLEGDEDALSSDEKAGFNTFVEVGCASCHTGTLIGGASYQKLGQVQPWPDTKDTGRLELTKDERDRYVFKVSSLRNIRETAPYFHDGSVPDLSDAVRQMAEVQLGRKLSAAQVDSIVSWLGSLTGTIPADTIKEPALPASGPKTPAPDPS